MMGPLSESSAVEQSQRSNWACPKFSLRAESPQLLGFRTACRGPSWNEPSISATSVFTIDSPRLRDLRQSKPGGLGRHR